MAKPKSSTRAEQSVAKPAAARPPMIGHGPTRRPMKSAREMSEAARAQLARLREGTGNA